jgi:hypothetical protein
MLRNISDQYFISISFPDVQQKTPPKSRQLNPIEAANPLPKQKQKDHEIQARAALNRPPQDKVLKQPVRAKRI